MALQSKTVTYTPFNKTSWGFASGDLSGTHSGLTNVKVVITPQTSTHWDATGHISTAGSGSAVASYNKQKFEWTCSGPLADVDAVLDALDFFPADYPAIRNWTTTATKTNATNGTYANENPADTDAIPDTDFDLKVYDLSDGSLDGTYAIKFDATQPTFGKQRPYWSTEPTNEDANTAAHDAVAGGLLDLGEISQLIPGTSVSDTDPLTVTCQFRPYGSTSIFTGSAYGQFTPATNTFIGDKKPGTTNTSDKRINFTGTKAEVQSYLDNVRYYNMGNELVFDMFFTLSNGVVGSTLTKSIWFSDATIGLTTVPNQRYDEDTAGPWDFGALTTSDIPVDVDNYKAIITVPTAAASNITSSTTGVTQSYTAGTGVYEVSHSSEATLLTALRNITFTPETDYDADFDMTVQLNYTGTTLGSSYTSTAQTVAVVGEGTEEIGNPETIHTYTEDHVYYFSNGTLPQIIHPINDSFIFTFTMNNQAGKIWKLIGGSAIITDIGNGVFTLAGTRDNVNADLLRLYYVPTPDYFLDHRINFTAVRTSGGGTPPTITGFFDMAGTDVGEFTSTPNVNVVWEEDTNLVFDTGLQIVDEADETVDSPAFGTHYTVSCEMWQPGFAGAPAFTDGILKVDDAGRSSNSITAGSFVVGNSYTITSTGTTDFTLIGSTDSNVETVFTATGVGTGTGTATGDSLTITGTGNGNTAFGGSTFTISGPKSEVNKAIQNLKFIPDPDYDGDGPWVWYYIDRNYDSISLTNVAITGYSYDRSLITKFLPASSTEDYFPTSVVLDWEENVTKVFDSGLVINDKVTENPEYNTSPTAFYNTTYTVEVAMYVGPGSTEYTKATLDTATKGSLTISGTGQGDTNKFIMTGSRADLNVALKNMKFIPDADNVETTNQTSLWYRIKRNYDYNASTGVGLLHDQTSDVKTTFNTNTATTNTTINATTDNDWNEDEVFDFDSGIAITDKATENQDYGNLFDTTFTATIRAKFWETLTAGSFEVGAYTVILSLGDTDWNAVAGTTGVTYSVNDNFTAATVGSGTGTAHQPQPLNNAIWTTTSSGAATVSGVGTVADPLTITGIKADVNTALANLRMAGDTDWTTPSPSTVASFWIETQLTRDADAITYINFSEGGTTFNPGTAVDPYVATVSPAMTYNEDTVTKIFDGKTLGISESASDYHPDIKYQVEVEISPNADGTWNDTGNSTYITAKNTRQLVNADLLTLDFRPTLDSAEDPSILYKQTRYQNVSAGSFVIGTTYTILTPGDTDFTLIGAADSASGTVFTATGVGTGTGTADIVTVQADGTVNIGTVTGTPVVGYVETVSGMVFTEQTDTSLFSGKSVGISEELRQSLSATYTVELEISPSTHGNWKGTNGNHIKTITGTKTIVNAEIQAAIVEPSADGPTLTAGSFVIGNKYTILTVGDTDFTLIGAADSVVGTIFTATGVGAGTGTATESIDFDILYSQTRHIPGSADVVQGTDVNIGTATGVDMPEFIYGTANQNIQYHVPESHFNGVDTNDTEENILSENANVELTPRQLTLNQNLVYERPITVTDTYEVGGPSQYKIIFSGGTLLTSVGASLSVMDTGWGSKADIHTILDNGLHVTGINHENDNHPGHRSTHTANFTLHRKLYTGTETQIANGQLNYYFLTGIDAFHGSDNPWWHSISGWGAEGEYESYTTRTGATIQKFGELPYRYTRYSPTSENDITLRQEPKKPMVGSSYAFTVRFDKLKFVPSGTTEANYSKLDEGGRNNFHNLGWNKETGTIVEQPFRPYYKDVGHTMKETDYNYPYPVTSYYSIDGNKFDFMTEETKQQLANKVLYTETPTIRVAKVVEGLISEWGKYTKRHSTPNYSSPEKGPDNYYTFNKIRAGDRTMYNGIATADSNGETPSRLEIIGTSKEWDGTEVSDYLHEQGRRSDYSNGWTVQIAVKAWMSYGTVLDIGHPKQAPRILQFQASDSSI
jgi:hypothetical protein